MSNLGASPYGTTAYAGTWEDGGAGGGGGGTGTSQYVLGPVEPADNASQFIGPFGPVGAQSFTNLVGPIGPVQPAVSGTTLPRARLLDVLGCGTYRVAVEPRGGGPELLRIAHNAVGFTREWCNMAEWSVNVKGVESCSPACPDLASLRPYRHEIVIYRTGEDGLAEEVSRGPVTGFDTQSGSVVIQGNDLLKWLARRVVHTDLTPVEPIDCTLLAMSVIADAMGVDPSPGLTTVFMGLTGVKVAPEIEAYNHYASDVLATLVQSGLAYRLRGRELLLGPAALVGDVAPTQTLRDGDFITPPKLSGLGDGQANGTYVKPDQEPVAEDGTELAPITGVYVDGAASDLDGRLERLVRDPGVVTQVDADTVAFNQTRDTMVTPMNVTANTLAPRAPVKMAQLVPGALWRAELAGCFGFGTVVRLTSLRVTASPGREAVEPACSPVGLVAP